MHNPLRDPFRHNSWATRTLLDACAGLSDDQLAATAPGAYGSVLATLQHLVGAEARYRFRLTGEEPAWYWGDREPPGIAGLKECAEEMAGFWERWLNQPFDPERTAETRAPDGTAHLTPYGVLVAQTLNHANEHRDQVNTILTTLGLEAPDLQGWAYGFASGRIRPA